MWHTQKLDILSDALITDQDFVWKKEQILGFFALWVFHFSKMLLHQKWHELDSGQWQTLGLWLVPLDSLSWFQAF